MKKIQEFNIARLHVQENFEFLRKICEKESMLPTEGSLEAEGLPESTTTLVTNATNNLIAKNKSFDDTLKASARIPGATLAAETDAKRDKAWRGGRKYADVMGEFPDEEISATAKSIAALFDKYGDPTKKSQDEESGIIHNLLQDFEALEEGVMDSIHFTPWYEYLKTTQAAFLEADQQRNAEKSAQEAGVIKAAQTEANQAYRELVDAVNALVLVNGETPYAAFIDSVNAEIADKKTVVKTRATLNAKKRKA